MATNKDTIEIHAKDNASGTLTKVEGKLEKFSNAAAGASKALAGAALAGGAAIAGLASAAGKMESLGVAMTTSFQGDKAAAEAAMKTIQELNSWLDGSRMPLRKKGSQSVKEKNLPIIILSNYSLEGAYSKAPEEKLDTLRCRLEIVEVELQLNLFTL